MKTLAHLLPFSYIFSTRLRRDPALLFFHGHYEWLPNVLLIWWFAGGSLAGSVLRFLDAYLAFISIYEIGYLANDVVSVRKEESPRRRLGFEPAWWQVTLWVACRVAVFAVFTWRMSLYVDTLWWEFFGILVVAFALHNMFADYAYRIVTFLTLATMRFFAPLIVYVSRSDMAALLAPVLITYVFYRTINYLRAKDVLNLPTTGVLRFKIAYYVLAMGLAALMAEFSGSPLPLLVVAYYLAGWLVFASLCWFRQAMPAYCPAFLKTLTERGIPPS